MYHGFLYAHSRHSKKLVQRHIENRYRWNVELGSLSLLFLFGDAWNCFRGFVAFVEMVVCFL
jgi:hypothetical protein